MTESCNGCLQRSRGRIHKSQLLLWRLWASCTDHFVSCIAYAVQLFRPQTYKSSSVSQSSPNRVFSGLIHSLDPAIFLTWVSIALRNSNPISFQVLQPFSIFFYTMKNNFLECIFFLPFKPSSVVLQESGWLAFRFPLNGLKPQKCGRWWKLSSWLHITSDHSSRPHQYGTCSRPRLDTRTPLCSHNFHFTLNALGQLAKIKVFVQSMSRPASFVDPHLIGWWSAWADPACQVFCMSLHF